jgi:glucosylceramidase
MSAIRLFLTAKESTARLTEQTPPTFTSGPPSGAVVEIDPRTRYQTIIGFGGSFTEAAAVTFDKLPAARQAELLRAYFDSESGHGYTLCRTHINSCDFALGNYAYDEVEGDVELQHFSIEHDRQALLPMIKAAFGVAHDPLKMLASPWSPPAWMKTNGEMNHGGRLKPEYRPAWADYYCRYIEAYAAEGIPIWGLTVQNEPEAKQTWDSCLYTAEEERDFVRDHLGPALARHRLNDVRLLIWDHNRDVMFARAKTVFDDPEAAQYVWGTGFHWYETPQRFDNVQRVHDAYPDKHLIFTEGCQEGGPHLGEWGLGERYAHAMLNDLNAWTEGWIDWNLLLDERGGPNHVGNYCSAPIIADTQTGELLYQSSYYYIGHFARFIRPGARRIGCRVTAEDLEAAAFRDLDGELVVVVLNRSDVAIPFALTLGDRVMPSESPARSIQTFCLSEN